jgi:hypothetical protein
VDLFDEPHLYGHSGEPSQIHFLRQFFSFLLILISLNRKNLR